MSSLALTILLASACAMLVVPRRLAALPLLIGGCYITRAQGIELGPFTFMVVRILIVVGLVRVVLRREWIERTNGLDRLLLLWGAWLLCSAAFRERPLATLITHSGIAFDLLGFYLLFRAFCRSWKDIADLCHLTALALVPIALEMLSERYFVHNLFSVFGGVSETPSIRNGQIRAQGPFAHAIMAGTIGGVCLPLAVGLWWQRRRVAIAGVIACTAIVFASVSSGPILTALGGAAGLACWPWRHRMRQVRLGLVLAYVLLAAFMNRPAYYAIAAVDLAGGSTGWHRARLIDSALQRAPEWALAGTDYTRHWMPTGVSWSAQHTDITNHYIRMGVLGGLPLLLLFIAAVATGFWYVGLCWRRGRDDLHGRQWLAWAFGASLFAHAVTCFGVSYFDQSVLFLSLTLAGIGSLYSASCARGSVSSDGDPAPLMANHPWDKTRRAPEARKWRLQASPRWRRPALEGTAKAGATLKSDRDRVRVREAFRGARPRLRG